MNCAKTLLTALITGTVAALTLNAGIVEKTSFQEVTSRLDAGGSLYFYITPEKGFSEFGKKYQEIQKLLISSPAVPENNKKDLKVVLDLIAAYVQDSGIAEIDGIGGSNIAIAPQLYRGRWFVHHAPGAKGLLWNLLGNAPMEFKTLPMLPENTIMANASYLQYELFWKWMKAQMVKVKAEAMTASVTGFEQQLLKQGIDLNKILASVNGETAFILTADETKKIDLPLPGIALQIPEMQLAIAIAVKDDYLFNVLRKKIPQLPVPPQQQGQATTAQEKLIQLPLPPIVPSLSPVILQRGGFLYFATNIALINQMENAAKTGKNLINTAAYKELTLNVPQTGNSYKYVNRKFISMVSNLQTQLMQANDSPLKLAAPVLAKMDTFALFSVIQNLPDGSLDTYNMTADPTAALVLNVSALPTAMIAGMMLPALSQAREKSQSISCAANLKAIGLNVKMYAMEHNNMFPPNLGDIAESLKKNGISPQCLSGGEYIYLSGFGETSGADLPVAFDRPGNHKRIINVLFVDGHVEGIVMPAKTCTGVIEFLNRKFQYAPQEYQKLLQEAAKYDVAVPPPHTEGVRSN